MVNIGAFVGDYFHEVDMALERLSNHYEQRITGLPTWVLCTRRINIAHVPQNNVFLISAIPDVTLNSDAIYCRTIKNNAELQAFAHNIGQGSIKLKGYHRDFYYQFADVFMLEADNINAIPQYGTEGLFVFVSTDIVHEQFSLESARKNALDLWNNALLPELNGSSLASMQQIFSRCRDIIKRRGFLERRIHRYLNSYAAILLPEHRRCFFEHALFLDGERVVADFILDRGDMLPALLIELENPVNKLYTQAGDHTARANHARGQINDWIQFIDENSENMKGDMRFLAGPKQRMVVIGRGLEQRNHLLSSRHSDTLMLSYDVLIEDAKARWNNIIIEQYKLVGIEEPNLIH